MDTEVRGRGLRTHRNEAQVAWHLLSGVQLLLPSKQLPCLFFFFLLVPHLQHMEVPRLWVESELPLMAFAIATATAMPDPSCICDLCRSWQQYWILNLLSQARDRTCILTDTSQVLNPLSHKGNSTVPFCCLADCRARRLVYTHKPSPLCSIPRAALQ